MSLFLLVALGLIFSLTKVITASGPSISNRLPFVHYFSNGVDVIAELFGPKTAPVNLSQPLAPVKTPYSHVLNFTSIDALWSKDGLPLKFLNEEVMRSYESEGSSCLVVTIASIKFNSGKTTVQEKSTGKHFGADHAAETKGVSGYRDGNICYQEIMGSGRADKQSSDRHQSIARDFVLTQIAQKLSQVLIFVVNELTIGDIEYLLRFQSDMKMVNPDAHIIYIHNPYSYSSEEAMQILIQNDIVNGFGAKPHEWPDLHTNQTTTWWSGRDTNEIHLLFGNHSNVLGQKYNAGTLRIVRNHLEMLKSRARHFNPTQEYMDTISASLPLITMHPNLPRDKEHFLPMVNPSHTQIQAAAQQSSRKQTDHWMVKKVKSFISTMSSGMGNKEWDECKVYKDLSLDVFNVKKGEVVKAVPEDGSIIVPLKLADPNINLTYFNASDLRPGSNQATDLMFNVKHEVFITKNTKDLIMRFELLDSKFDVTFENRKLTMMGCRLTPDYEVETMLTKADKPRYSTFYLVIEIPDAEDYPYDLQASNLKATPELLKPVNGILTLKFPKNK